MLYLSAKYNFGLFSQALKIFVFMFTMFTFSIAEVQGQRIRQGYEWTCDYLPSPVPSENEAPPPTLCQAVGDLQDIIEIGEGTPFPDAITLGKATFSGNASDLNLAVVGDFHINEDWYAYKCIFKVSPNVTIFVDNQVRFTSNNSKFFCCEAMWEGIRVGQEASITFRSSSHIEDAKIAIRFTNEARSVRISDATFNRDEIGIEITGNLFSKNPLYAPLKTFYGNTFNCTSKLNKGSSYDYTRIGLSASSVQIPTLGTYFANKPNIFTGRITLGIALFAADVKVSNCQFIDISTGPTPPKAPNTLGLGIWAQYGNLNVTGLGIAKNDAKTAKPTFKNCEDGAIRAETVNLDIKDTYFDFTSIVYPLSSTATLSKLKNVVSSTNNSSGQSINIHDNLFNMYFNGTGILVTRSSSSINEIKNNYIEINAFRSKVLGGVSMTGIAMQKGYSSKNSSGSIEGNTIHDRAFLGELLTGIVTSGGKNYNVKNNFIDGLPSLLNLAAFKGIGILSNFCTASSYTGNKVFNGEAHIPLVLNKEPTTMGFKFVNTSITTDGIGSLSVCGNYSSINKNGFLFEGNNNATIFSHNQMQDLNGLHLLQNMGDPVIGYQWFKDQFRKNFWLTSIQLQSWGDKDARIKTGNPTSSQFFTNDKKQKQVGSIFQREYPLGGIEVPKAINPATNIPYTPDDWFNYNPSILKEDKGCDGFVDSKPSDSWTPLLEDIVQGKYNNQFPVLKWEAERYLYRAVQNQPAMIEVNTKAQSFYKKLSLSNIPLFNEIQDEKDNLFYDENLDYEITELRNTERNVWEHFMILSETYNEAFGESEWNEKANNEAKQISTQLSNIETALKAKIEERATLIVAKTKDLMAKNDKITPATRHEEAAKQINALWLKAIIQEGDLNEEDLNTIRTWVSECFNEIGTAKYQGIEMLPECEQEPYWYSPCEQGTLDRITKKQNFVVSPNPANDYLKVQLEDVEKIDKLVLSDVSGKILSTITNGFQSQFSIDVSSYQNGLYLLSVYDKNNNVNTYKISIAH